jgi:hypothetical protein
MATGFAGMFAQLAGHGIHETDEDVFVVFLGLRMRNGLRGGGVREIMVQRN